MRLLILANPEDPHTIKWVTNLAKQDIEIFLFGLNQFDSSIYKNYSNVQLKSLGFDNKFIHSKLGNFTKILYLRCLPKLKEVIKEFNPDIIHAHYASSYGILTSLINFSPVVLSVWGSDIYRFPKKSFFHKLSIKNALAKADYILSTSHVMASEINRYTKKAIKVIPFGIDTKIFKPFKKEENGAIVIGTVRKLQKLYGVDVLVRAFKIVVDRNKDKSLELLIVGDGPERKNLEILVERLNINSSVKFTGNVQPDKVPDYLNKMDIFSALSIYDESFGVAVLEASACEKPVVVSDVAGFKEIVNHGETGFIVERNNPEQAASAIESLINEETLRTKFGKNARKHVIDNYSLSHNVEEMIQVYQSILDNSNNE